MAHSQATPLVYPDKDQHGRYQSKLPPQRSTDRPTTLPSFQSSARRWDESTWSVAVHIHKLPLEWARDSDILQGRYLNTLNAMPNQREPYPRPGISLMAQKLQQQMNDNLPPVEAALMQVVGQQNGLQCTRCLQLFGIFSQCVSVRNVGGLSACTNCHWEEQDDCCRYLQTFGTSPKPKAGPSPLNPRQDTTSTNFLQNPARNPFRSHSHTSRTDIGTASGTIIRPLQRLEMVNRLVGQLQLMRQSIQKIFGEGAHMCNST